jgi:hypothetical protein
MVEGVSWFVPRMLRSALYSWTGFLRDARNPYGGHCQAGVLTWLGAGRGDPGSAQRHFVPQRARDTPETLVA